MALGPKLLDDTFGPKATTGRAKPRGAALMDDLFGAPQDEGYNSEAFRNRGRAGETVAAPIVAPRDQDDRQREANRRRDERAASAPIAADSEAERVGTKFWQRIRALGAGGGRLAGAALEEIGIDPNGEAASWLRAKSESGERYANRAVEGETTWEDLKARPSIGGLARFVLEQGGSSVADMGVLATGAGILPYVGLQAGSTGQQRAQNDERADADAEDVFKALPSAVASAALERLGIHGIFGPGARTVGGRIVQAFGAEALTEALQSPIEYAGSNLGTKAGFDPMEALDQAAAGAVAGGFMGGGIRAGIETPGAIARRLRRGGAAPAPGVIEQAEAQTAPVTPDDAASPLPTELIAEGKAIAGAATAQTDADGILRENGAPAVGTRVSLTINGKTRTGTIRDAFVDASDAELGAQQGVNIDLDGGGTMREFFADLRDAGVELSPVTGIDPKLIEQAQADMAAGGMNPSATLDVIAETGETPVVTEAATPIATPSATTPPEARGFDVNGYVARARQAESGGNDAAKARTSSASGRFQFTDGTFRQYWQKVFGTEPDMAQKNDPQVQDALMRAFTADNVAGLRKAGVEVTEARAYAAHHFGLGGAIDMIRNPDGAVDAAIVKANPQFKGMSNAQALAWVANHIGRQGGNSVPSAPFVPVELDENQRPRMSDEPLTTAQVEAPAAPAAAEPAPTPAEEVLARPVGLSPEEVASAPELTPEQRSVLEQARDSFREGTVGRGNAERLLSAGRLLPDTRAFHNASFLARMEGRFAPVSAQEPVASTATITATPSGKGIAVAGASEAELAAIAQAVPKARATPNKDGALVYSAKYRAEIEAALSSVTPASTAPAEQPGLPIQNGQRVAITGADGTERVYSARNASATTTDLDPEDGMSRSTNVGTGALGERIRAGMARILGDGDTVAPRRELTLDEQRASMRVSDTLPGGMPVEQAAAVARSATPQRGDQNASSTLRAATMREAAEAPIGYPVDIVESERQIEYRHKDTGEIIARVFRDAAGVKRYEVSDNVKGEARADTAPTPIGSRDLDIMKQGFMKGSPEARRAEQRRKQGARVTQNDTPAYDPDLDLKSDERAALENALKSQKVGGLGWAKDSSAGMAATRMLTEGRAIQRSDLRIIESAARQMPSAPKPPTDRSVAIVMDPAAGTTRTVPVGNQRVETERAEKPTNPGTTQQMPGARTRKEYETQGWNAAESGWSIEDNPYYATSTAATAWDKGFRSSSTVRRPIAADRQVDAAPAREQEGATAPAPTQQAERDSSGGGEGATSTYGANNKLVTRERAEELRAKLRAKMGQINSGIDPEVLALGTELAVFHIESGARKFADFSRRMIADIGETARPYLRSFYEAARYYPGVETMAREMSSPAEIEEEGRGDQGAVRPGDAGAGAADVQRAAPDGGARRAPASEGDRGGGDVQAVERERADAPERADEGRAAATRDRGAGEGSPDRVPADAARTGRGRRADSPARDAERVAGGNWRIEPGALDEARGAAQKARDNVAAIEIVKELDRTGKPATREQQAALAKYVGWGGLKGAFNETNGTFPKGFEQIGPRVRELLTAEEYDTARRSIQYAHYTSEKIIRPMWDAALRMGFTGGKVFEPGMGTGNFVGMMPAEVAAKTQYQGIEFDGITARIAQLLYPESGIRHADFTQGVLPADAFDLVIGNPPFSQTVVKSDPQFGNLGFVLHDFFFAKSLNAVRPGGLLMFVTSAGTMNKVSTEARAWLADRADLVGAVRLPGGAFRENAGTDVTTDIIVLRKRMPGAAPGDRSWVDTREIELPSRSGGTVPAEVNAYFLDNPDQVLGEQGMFDTLTAGERYGVRLREGADMAADLTRALGVVSQAGRMEAWTGPANDFDTETTERKEGSFYIGSDGRLMQHRGGLGAPVEGRGKGVKGGMSAAEQERVRALVPIRDALRAVLHHDMNGRPEAAEAARKELNGVYDRFVQQFGPINKAEIRYQRPSVIEQESARAAAREEVRLAGGFFNEGSFTPPDPNAKLAEIAAARKAAREASAALGREWDEGDFDPAEMPDKVIVKRPNVDAFMDDQEGYRLRSIEHYNDDTGEAQKGAVFFRNVVSQDREPEIKGAGDALLYTLNRTGRPDIDEIAARAGLSRGQVLEELADKVFRIPGQGETYQTREQYLSGNVRDKLATARAAAERDPDFRRNVAALEAVQPTPLGPSDISVGLGMPWIPQDVVRQFAESIGLRGASVTYFPKFAQWTVSGDRSGAAARSEWGTGRRDAVGLLADALNRQTPVVYDTFRDADGKEQRVRNDVETQAAQDKIRAILDRFREWVWEDQGRADELVALYNRDYNNLVAPTYDGSYLTTPGIAEGWSWRPHQRRVVSRIIQSGNTYMAHAVGAGKTSAMIGAGMEMRRLGLVRKPMYVVPNHMLGQFTKEFYEQYPTAKIMVADEKQFHTDRRKQFIANVGTSDLDAVIITHSAFGFIPISDEFNEGLLRQQIDEFREILTELKSQKSGNDQSQRITQRNIEQQIEAMEQKIKGRKKRSDQVFTFEETGVDFLFVDEAHLFRKLDFATKMSNVRGVDPNGSGMSYDLFAKTRYLETRAPGRSHVLASGTPVTNTMAELFSVQRYLQPDELAARALGQFDAWAGAFGETVTQLEQDPAGGYKPVTRFAKFVNVPELSAMVRQVMDVVTSRELEQYVVRPKLKDGKRQMIVAQPTPALSAYQQTLQARMTAIENRRGKPKKGDDILLSVIGDGRKAAIDMRLVDPSIREEDKSKLELMIDNVSRIAAESKDQPFHRAEATGYAAKPFMRGRATQMIFSDLGINGEFPIHRYIKQQLVARGLKEGEVAIISDFKTSVARQRLFNDMNEGKVRVLIGSVPKMGTGVNAQKRLLAIHNLDPQWYPANDEQRNGRGLRQGNMNPELGIYDYSTKATYDSTMWNMMETKARFIEGFFNGDPTMRSMDDLGEASQYEQAKALTTADPRIMQLTQDKQDLERAMLRRAAHERGIFSARERIRYAQESIERNEKAIPVRERDIADRQDIAGDAFTAKVGTETYDDREAFGEAVLARMNDLMGNGLSVRDRPVGEIGGFRLTADVTVYGKNTDVALYLNRNGGVQERVKTNTPAGIAQSVAGILRGFEGDVEKARDAIVASRREIEEFTPQTTKTFGGAAEIVALEEKVSTMEATLTREAAERAAARAPGATPPPEGAKLSSVTEGAAPEGEIDLEALRQQLATEARRMGVDGDRLVVRVVNTLLNNKRIAGMYLQGVLSVAARSPQALMRTFHHEFVHALKDMGLFRPAEWVALTRAAESNRRIMESVARRYPELDREGRIEEAVAEMFAEWKGRRVGFVGAAMARIADFIAAVRRLVSRADTAGDIMRRIDRGEIGARTTPEGTELADEAKQSILGSPAAYPNPTTVSEALERARTFVGRMAEGYEDWRIKLQDRMLPILRAEAAAERVLGRELTDAERPYLAEELMSGRVGAKMDTLADEHIDPLWAALEAEKISTDELESYLYAKHAPERNAYIASINPDFGEGEGSGMSDIEAAAILSRIEREGRTKEFERVAERVYSMLRFARDERFDAGLLSEEQLDSWNSAYEFYVPLRGFAELDGANERPNQGGAGLTVRGKESKRAFGRRSQADDILAYSIMQAEEAIVRGEKNRVARAFYDLAKAAPDDDFWKTNKVTMQRRMNPLTGLVETYPVTAMMPKDEPMTISLKIDGKERRVTMNERNPDAVKLAAAMRRLDEAKTNGAIVFMSKVNRWLSSVNTSLNPEFTITNAFRDIQTAAVNLAGIDVPGLQRNTLRDWRAAMAGATRGAFGRETGEWGRWWREFTDEGGRVAYNQMQDLATLRRDMERRFDPKRRPGATGLNTSPKQMALIALGDIKAAYGFIDKINTGVENGVRLAAYKNAREAGLSPARAASIAKNLTVNFNRRGEWGAQVNAFYLFYNASIQGSVRMLTALGSRRVQKIVAGIVVAGFAQELLNMMLSGDDDDGDKLYDKVPDFEKQRNMILMVSGPWGDYLKIPMPYGFNAFHSLGRNMARIARGERFTAAATDAFLTFADAFNPIGGGTSLLNLISPTLIDPVVDLTQNKDFADRPIMPDEKPFGPQVPDNQRYWNNVSPVWREVAQALNTGTGGDEVLPGAVDVSPETLEYLFGVATGAAGAFVDRSLAAPVKALDGDPTTELTINDAPVIRKLVGSKPAWYDKAAFYARLDEVDQIVGNAKQYAQIKGPDAVRSYIAEEKGAIGLMDAAKFSRARMAEVRKAKNQLILARDKGELTTADYAAKLERVTAAEKEVIDGFNAAYLRSVKQPLRP